MRVLLVRGYPRKNGHTHQITHLFSQGLSETDAHVDDIDLTTRHITPCIGCYKCWTHCPGACIYKDDMTELVDLLIKADVMVLATPMYYCAMSACMKVFLERTFPITREGFDITPSGRMKNRLRYPENWHKRLILITTGAFKSIEGFDPMRLTFRDVAEGMSAEPAGEIVRPESFLLQFALAKPKTIKAIETACIRAGYEAGTEGRISEETQTRIATPLSPSLEIFTAYSNIYWEHVADLGEKAMDLAAVQQRVVTDVRILMQAMVENVDPVATKGIQASLQFDFPDKDWHFLVKINRGTCTLSYEQSSAWDLRVQTDTLTWAGVFQRNVNVKDALLDRRVVLEGDKSLFVRLERYFPPPVD